MVPPPPVLMDEIVEEIVLRLPPDESGALVRAALACKSWCRLISNPKFHRRFREFHRSARMLGFLLDLWDKDDSNSYIARFVPMSPSSFPPRADRRGFALDARHGRILLYTVEAPQQDDLFLLDYHFVVWNPIKDQQTELPVFSWYPCCPAWKAAVLCAGGATCDHLACHDEPFLVLFVGIVAEYVYIYEYSSETGTWSGPTANGYLGPLANSVVPMGPSLLAEGALHFAIEDGRRILRYGIAECSLSVMAIPQMAQNHCVGNMGLVTTEDVKLGVAGVVGYKLYLWSVLFLRPDNVLTWNLGRIIELDMMLSIDIGLPSTRFFVVGYAEGAGTVFVSACDGIHAVVLEFGQVKKVHERTHFCGIVPYVSFYTSDIARSILPPSAHQ